VPPRGVGELILLVDDERAILSLTRRVLELAGYRVVTADNGAHAIGLFSARAAEIALVLTDLSMPAMDGTSLIGALRKVTPALPILATSGNADEATSRRLEELGVFRLLAKPYGTEALLSAIREALTRGPRAR
jgi:CheY-like chemotaxis protein